MSLGYCLDFMLTTTGIGNAGLDSRPCPFLEAMFSRSRVPYVPTSISLFTIPRIPRPRGRIELTWRRGLAA